MADTASNVSSMRWPYIYAWGNNARRAEFKGLRCRIVTRGRMRSVLVEFESGWKMVTSERSLRVCP